jgi:hypothetical protein
MGMEELIEYHSTRAREELDLGLIAQGMAAARSHLQLASLHMQRVRELSGSRVSTGVPALMM